VLGRINDNFVHANPEYYGRHLRISPGDAGYINLSLVYFDDDPLQEVNLLAFLHILLVVQDSLLTLFQRLFQTLDQFSVGIETFGRDFGDQINRLAEMSNEYHAILTELGLWSAKGKGTA